MSHQAGSSQAGPSRAGRAKRNSRVAESDSEDEGSPVLEHGRKKRRVIAETQEAQESEDGDGDSGLNELGSDDGTARVKGKGRANGNGHLEDGDDDEDDEDEDGDQEMIGQANGDEGALAIRPEYDRDPKDKYVQLPANDTRALKADGQLCRRCYRPNQMQGLHDLRPGRVPPRPTSQYDSRSERYRKEYHRRGDSDRSRFSAKGERRLTVE